MRHHDDESETNAQAIGALVVIAGFALLLAAAVVAAVKLLVAV